MHVQIGQLQKEGFEPVTNCYQLKLVSPMDGKKRLTDVATTQQFFRIIQSIPSKKAETIKQWMAQVAAERLNQILEQQLGHSIISPEKASDYLPPADRFETLSDNLEDDND